MSEFTLLIRRQNIDATPDRESIERWAAWFKDLTAKGHMKDPGHPLQRVGSVVKGKDKVVVDGPYAEAKDIIGGYLSIEAKDLNQATELAKGCPILNIGGSVEVRQVQIVNM